MTDPLLERYSRQTVLAEIGPAGQVKLGAATVVVLGCGALGSVQAQLLVRAGLGHVRIVDRDLVEQHNLHRQLLFDEEDVRTCLPKAAAAEKRLAKVNSEVAVEGMVVDITASNVERLLEGADLVLDGLDNFETRYLANDACVKRGIPWVYGGVIGTIGMGMVMRPDGPCLRCVFPEPPEPGSAPTCDTAGVLNAAPVMVGAWQVAEAVKLLVDPRAASRGLQVFDLWQGSFQSLAVERDPACPCCSSRRFDYLDARRESRTAVLCGGNSVQITPASEAKVSFDDLAQRLSPLGEVRRNRYLLEFKHGRHELVVFSDGRAIVRGTEDEALARSLYARYVGT